MKQDVKPFEESIVSHKSTIKSEVTHEPVS